MSLKLSSRRRRRLLAFTLVELLVVLGIIALLGVLALPAYSSMILKAQSVQCAGHLRAIGMAVMHATTDNNNFYPEIDQAATPIYPAGSGAQGIVATLSSYGITTNDIKCPVDLQQSPSSFQKYGSSYEWNPIFDDGSVTSTIVVINGTLSIPVNSTRVRLCTDFLPLHNNKMNALYGDGHVTAR